MSFTIEQTTTEKYYISVELETRANIDFLLNVYIVRVCPKHGENLFGYPERETIYTDIKQSHKTYLRYIREYKKR